MKQIKTTSNDNVKAMRMLSEMHANVTEKILTTPHANSDTKLGQNMYSDLSTRVNGKWDIRYQCYIEKKYEMSLRIDAMADFANIYIRENNEFVKVNGNNMFEILFHITNKVLNTFDENRDDLKAMYL
jgi:plasmid maintenance system killer protein